MPNLTFIEMLTPDKNHLLQKDFEYMEFVCMMWMYHYNFMLSVYNTETDEFFYQEHFNEYKWYDV